MVGYGIKMWYDTEKGWIWYVNQRYKTHKSPKMASIETVPRWQKGSWHWLSHTQACNASLSKTSLMQPVTLQVTKKKVEQTNVYW